jgi:hypothetical protein
MIDRPTKIVATALVTAGSGSIRDADPHALFAKLSQCVPDLAIDELLVAADRAKLLSSELKGLHHRLGAAAAHRQRRADNLR